MTAPQLELMPMRMLTPDPVAMLGDLVPAKDRGGYVAPQFRAGVPREWLLNPTWWGRLIWCRPDGMPSTYRTVGWRVLDHVEPGPGAWGWVATVADPDGTRHTALLTRTPHIAVTRREWESAATPLPDDAPDYRTLDKET